MFESTIRMVFNLISAFFIIFAASIFWVEFFLRDVELIKIRDIFTRAWVSIDNASLQAVNAAIQSRNGILFVLILSLFLCLFFTYIQLEDLIGNESWISNLRFWAFILIWQIPSIIIVFILQKEISHFSKFIVSKSSIIDMFFELSKYGAIIVAVGLIIDASPRDLQIPSKLSASLIIGLPLAVYTWVWLIIFFMTFIYTLANILLLFSNRLILRICENQKGPVYAVALMIALAGIVIQVFSFGEPEPVRY